MTLELRLQEYERQYVIDTSTLCLFTTANCSVYATQWLLIVS